MSLAFLCAVAFVIDGDTLRCANGVRVRLAGIDAPEMPGHCARYRQCTPGDPSASRDSLIVLVQGKTLRCNSVGKSYNRTLAHCFIGRTSIGCAQVRRGQAVLRYSEKARVCG